MQIQKAKPGYKVVHSFPSFLQLEIPDNWNFTLIDEFAELIRGISYSSSEISSEDRKQILINLNCFKRGGGFVDKGILYFTGMTNKQPLETGEILLAITDVTREGNVIGFPLSIPKFKNQTKIYHSMDTSHFKLKTKTLDQKFLFYLLSSEFFHKSSISLSAGTTVLHLDLDSIKKVRLPIPSSLDEQQKIASILSNIDSLINQTQKEIEQSQKLKKELMQKLLTKGVEHKKFKKLLVIPRFIDFSIPESWEVMKLAELATEIKDGPMGFGLHVYDYVENGIPILRIQNIKNLTITKEDLRFISEDKHEELKKSQVKPLDIIISKTGILGMVGILPINYGPANLNQALARITLKNKNMIPYVATFLSSKIPQQILNVVGSGRTVQAGLKLSDIKNLEIPIPPLNEQQKIMSVLSNSNSYFENLKSKKSRLESLKKGLMQKLLTGEIRVKI